VIVLLFRVSTNPEPSGKAEYILAWEIPEPYVALIMLFSIKPLNPSESIPPTTELLCFLPVL
jgi:hypothetical protein